MNNTLRSTVDIWIKKLDTGGPITLNRQCADDLVFVLKHLKNELETYIEIFAEESKLS